ILSWISQVVDRTRFEKSTRRIANIGRIRSISPRVTFARKVSTKQLFKLTVLKDLPILPNHRNPIISNDLTTAPQPQTLIVSLVFIGLTSILEFQLAGKL
ncbi:MAG: hypothetical protein KDA68_17295, partial [Planctomycetaceae bacterium]|nr:hypothetical protein [Planctomycetaceae bacterium]